MWNYIIISIPVSTYFIYPFQYFMLKLANFKIWFDRKFNNSCNLTTISSKQNRKLTRTTPWAPFMISQVENFRCGGLNPRVYIFTSWAACHWALELVCLFIITRLCGRGYTLRRPWCVILTESHTLIIKVSCLTYYDVTS